MFYICIYSQEELPTIRLKGQCQAIPVSLYYLKDFFASMKFQTEITVEFCLITKGCVTVLLLLRMARMEMNLKSSETLYCTTCSVKNDYGYKGAVSLSQVFQQIMYLGQSGTSKIAPSCKGGSFIVPTRRASHIIKACNNILSPRKSFSGVLGPFVFQFLNLRLKKKIDKNLLQFASPPC